jgi:mannosyltransferase
MKKENSTLRYVILLICVLLLGIGLRLYDLSEESLWFDEGVSVIRSEKNLTGLLEDARNAGGNPPLYFIILHYWMELFGQSEWAVRLLSVLFGMISLVAAYRIGILLWDRPTALLTVLFAAISHYHINHAQEARCYTMMAALGVLSMDLFLRLIRAPRISIMIGYVLAGSALVYTHYYGPLFLVAQNLFLVGMWWKKAGIIRIRWRRWFILEGIILVSFLPWIHIMLGKTVAIQTQGLHYITPSVWDIPGTLKTYAAENAYLGVVMIVLAGLSLLTIKQQTLVTAPRQSEQKDNPTGKEMVFSNGQKICFLGLWLMTPILLPFAISQVSTPIFAHRYTIAASFGFYILAAKGVLNLRKNYLIYPILLILVTVYFWRIYRYYTEPTREQWREAVQRVEENARRGDRVLVHPNYCKYYIYQYYAQREDLVLKTFSTKSPQMDEKQHQELETLIRESDRIWFVIPKKQESKKQIAEILAKNYQRKNHWEYFRIDVYEFSKSP